MLELLTHPAVLSVGYVVFAAVVSGVTFALTGEDHDAAGFAFLFPPLAILLGVVALASYLTRKAVGHD